MAPDLNPTEQALARAHNLLDQAHLHNARLIRAIAELHSPPPLSNIRQKLEALIMAANELSDAVTQGEANVSALEVEAGEERSLILELRDELANLNAAIAANTAQQAQADAARAAQQAELTARVNTLNRRIAQVTGGLDQDQNPTPAQPTGPNP